MGGELSDISPVICLFNNDIGAGLASAGSVMKGVGALGGARKALTNPGGL